MKPIEKQLDVLWAEIIRLINGYGKKDRTVEAHHVVGRSKSVRWDLKNGAILTKIEHAYLKHHSHEAEAIFRHRLGDKEYDRLRQKSLKVKKWQPQKLEEIKQQFENIIKEVETRW